MNLTTLSVLLLAAALGGGAVAGEVYRWVDENGKVQFSDQPPPKGAGGVKRETYRDEVAPGQRKAAQERAARDQATLQRIDDDRKAARAAPRPAGGASAEEADDKLPPRGSAEDCRNWRQEYQNSQACFAPYRNARGGIKAEAFAVCGPEVLDPSAECGPPSNR